MVDVHYSDSVTYTYADTRERERETEVRLSTLIYTSYLLGGSRRYVQAKSDQAFAPRARLDGIVPVGYLLLERYRTG